MLKFGISCNQWCPSNHRKNQFLLSYQTTRSFYHHQKNLTIKNNKSTHYCLLYWFQASAKMPYFLMPSQILYATHDFQVGMKSFLTIFIAFSICSAKGIGKKCLPDMSVSKGISLKKKKNMMMMMMKMKMKMKMKICSSVFLFLCVPACFLCVFLCCAGIEEGYCCNFWKIWPSRLFL